MNIWYFSASTQPPFKNYIISYICSYSPRAQPTSTMADELTLPTQGSRSQSTTTSARITTTVRSRCGRCRTSPTTTRRLTSSARMRSGTELAGSPWWSLNRCRQASGSRIRWNIALTGSVSRFLLFVLHLTWLNDCC